MTPVVVDATHREIGRRKGGVLEVLDEGGAVLACVGDDGVAREAALGARTRGGIASAGVLTRVPVCRGMDVGSGPVSGVVVGRGRDPRDGRCGAGASTMPAAAPTDAQSAASTARSGSPT